MHPARYWTKAGKSCVCELCPRACVLGDGEWGACGARRAESGRLFACSYGRVMALCADPVEKKPLRRFMPGTMTLSIGVPGCNLLCRYCQNHSLSRSRPDGRIPEQSPEALVKCALEGGFPSISYTYNEPLINLEYVLDTARLAHTHGLKNIMVTNGYANPEPFEDALSAMDAMNIDIKSFSEGAFKEYADGELSVVLRNVERAAKRVHVEITSLMVPGLCEIGDVEHIAQFLGAVSPDIPLHITRYHPVGPDQPGATSKEDMLEAKSRAGAYLSSVFLGNV